MIWKINVGPSVRPLYKKITKILYFDENLDGSLKYENYQSRKVEPKVQIYAKHLSFHVTLWHILTLCADYEVLSVGINLSNMNIYKL